MRTGKMKSDEDDDVEIDVDKALEQLGTYGRYQIFACCLVSTAWLLDASQMMAMVFLNAIPPFACKESQLLNASDWTSSCAADCVRNGSGEVVFQKEFGSTIVSEWNLTCSREVMADSAGSIYMVGLSVGSIFVTPLSDRLGRKWSFIICCFFLLASGGISGLVPNYEAYMAFRFLGGFFYAGAGALAWMLGCELVAPGVRAYALAPMGFFWVVGYVGLGGVAYLIRDWRPFLWTTSFSLFGFIALYAWLLPESPHWLMATNQKAKAWAWFEKAAKVNRVKIKKLDCALEHSQSSVHRRKRNPLEIRKSRILIAHIVIGSVLYGVNTFVYYGITIFSTQLAGDRYVNYVLGGVIELPIFVFQGMILNGRLGRRGMLFIAQAMAGFAMIGLSFIPTDNKELTPLIVCVWILAKFSITSSFNCVFLYAAELFPTTLRGASLGLCNFTARVGGILAPYVRLTSSIDPRLPAVIFGVAALLAATLGALLPETRGKELPEDLADMKTSRALLFITRTKAQPQANSEQKKFIDT